MNDLPKTFGQRLRIARENQHFSIKDISMRLHLNSNVIDALESDDFENGPPTIFLRGYLRSYARLLNFSDADISMALSQLELTTPTPITPIQASEKLSRYPQMPSMRWVTYLIIALLALLVGTWWHSHNNSNTDKIQNTDASPLVVTVPSPKETLATPEPTTTLPTDNTVSPNDNLHPKEQTANPDVAPNATDNTANTSSSTQQSSITEHNSASKSNTTKDHHNQTTNKMTDEEDSVDNIVDTDTPN